MTGKRYLDSKIWPETPNQDTYTRGIIFIL